MQDLQQLVASMTLEEKASLCSGADFWHTKAVERLGIPAMMVSDGPHGLRTQASEAEDFNESIKAVCFPAGCATAASFDPALLREEGRIIGKEARAVGVGVVLGPAVNIKRSPLCGRNFEYYSEDPHLAGELAAAFIEGVQSQGVGTSIKHFAANSQEYRRMSVSSDMDERTLREIYLPAFETAVQRAQPWTVMCSYNRLNGVYASESEYLLSDLLRGEWGFEGFVMSDWGATANRIKGLEAGLELEMPASGGVNDEKIVAAVRDGSLPMETLDRAVIRLLNIIMRHADIDAAAPRPAFDLKADHAKAVEFAKSCAVLLKNRGVLPLSPKQKIAYIGGFAAAPRYQGGGSSHINTDNVDSALAVARSKGRSVQYAGGFPAGRDERNEEKYLQAIEAACNADVAVIFAGLPDSFESEGYDRKHMALPESQNNLISRIAAVQKNTVVVLHTGSPVECPWADDVAAVLCMYLGGEGVGAATDALLYGEANPSGRLPETWPLRLEDTPCALTFPGDGKSAAYTEGVYVGYRWYDARNMPVLWPFGHGLSYTGYVYRDASLSANTMQEGGSVEVTARVLNSGSMAGSEVVQLYVAPPAPVGYPARPVKELRHFAKVALEPGEAKTVSFTINTRDLSYYDETLGDWYAPTGTYKILLGHSSRDIHATLELNYTAARALPLEVDENTPMGDLLRDARTAPILQQLMAQYSNMLGANGGGENAAITQEAAMQMMDAMPLRALASFGGRQAAEGLPQLIAVLQQAVK